MRMTILVACLWLVTSPLWGKIVFYSHRDGNTEIYTMNSNGSNQTRLTFNEASDSSPVWSPNGQQIAFHSYRDGNAEIYVMDADGKNPRNLTRHPAFDVAPVWSPDGSQIAFESNRTAEEGRPEIDIYVMDADGSNVKQITDLGFASRPKWSPDGEWILFQGGEIFALHIDGTGLWQVSVPKPNTGMYLGGWSPDGTRILYTEAVDLNVNTSFPVITTLHPLGKQKVFKWERVKVPRIPLDTVRWGADGKSILFSAQKDRHWHIYRFRLDTHQLTQLTDSIGADRSPYEWNPRLSVQPQQLLPLFWGEIKSNRLRR